MVLLPAHKASIQALSNRRGFTMSRKPRTVLVGQFFDVVSRTYPLVSARALLILGGYFKVVPRPWPRAPHSRLPTARCRRSFSNFCFREDTVLESFLVCSLRKHLANGSPPMVA